jgi:hypothetical protein
MQYKSNLFCFLRKVGLHYPLGAIGTVPRIYDIFRTYEGMEGRKNKNKEIKK